MDTDHSELKPYEDAGWSGINRENNNNKTPKRSTVILSTIKINK